MPAIPPLPDRSLTTVRELPICADTSESVFAQHDCVVRTMTTSDGVVLHFRHYQAARPCRGIVIAMHGIQSHSGWYSYSSRKLADAGFDVYFADRRGSGLNGRQRGHADHGLRLLNDVRQLISVARRDHQSAVTAVATAAGAVADNARPAGSGPPVTVLGVSWGGKTAAALAATYPQLANRLALLYPGLEPQLRPGRWQSFQLNAARRHDVRHKSVPIPLSDPAMFTDDLGWQRFIAEDPLALHRVTSGFLNAGRDLDDIIRQHPERIVQPALVMLAGRDAIIDNDATRQRVATFGTPHLTQICYAQARHTLEFDACRERFVADLINWLSDTRH